MTSTEDLKTGIDLVTKAAEHDNSGRYDEAVYLYELSLQFLNKALQSTQQIFVPSWTNFECFL